MASHRYSQGRHPHLFTRDCGRIGAVGANAQDWRTVTMSRQVESEESVDVEAIRLNMRKTLAGLKKQVSTQFCCPILRKFMQMIIDLK